MITHLLAFVTLGGLRGHRMASELNSVASITYVPYLSGLELAATS